ncbi:MAG: sugar ABC transporter ATP-binding protein [Myxococcales bacterium]|nr:sugar ABC transporter ATP-binding protein [Myxococcales bacterium]
MTSRLSVRGLRRSYGATRALAGVALEVAPGSVHAVLGENGAGKSTLMKILAGGETADAGEVRLDGNVFLPGGAAEAQRLGVALVSQERALCPHLTVAENIALGVEPRLRGALPLLDRARMRREAEARLAEVLGETGRIPVDALAADLPIAEQQLVEIARALSRGGAGPSAAAVARCKVLILDEPTSSLGREDAARLFALARRLRGEGVSILYVSHFLEEIVALADHYTVLRDGATVASGAVAGTTTAELVTAMAGRRVDQLFVRSARAPGEVGLEVEGLASAPKPLAASFTLRRGEVLGIAGLMGAGRTELLRALFGLNARTAGTVRLGGRALGHATPSECLAAGVGLLSEDRQGEGLLLSRSIAENVTLSKLDGLGLGEPGSWLGKLSSALGLVAPARADAVTERLIERLEIKCRGPRQAVGELSGGNQQKVALARLLHHDVEVLLLDEPTRGIDVGSRARIYTLIDELALAGRAVVLCSSYLPELLGVCDRIAVMCRGRLGPARPAEAWSERALLEAALGATPDAAQDPARDAEQGAA